MPKSRTTTILLIIISVVLLFIFSLTVVNMFTDSSSSVLKQETIGIVEVQGMILDSAEIIEQVHYVRDQQSIKAVVLRIDSPGGVVGPTQEIYEEIMKLNKTKPVYVSMGSIAASGGYYIAAASTKIYANPGTITGSIGVLMKLANFQSLLDKVGIKSIVLKSGEFKDSGSPVRPLSAQDKKILQGVIDSLHGQFVSAVAKGRNLPLDKVKALADGRIFSGEQAMENNLIDKLGNLQDAVDDAAKAVGITEKPKLSYPPKPKHSIFDLLMESAWRGIAKAATARQSSSTERFEYSIHDDTSAQ
jgi:protease-4